MRTSAAGNKPRRHAHGFTLIELLVVMVIIAIGTAGVGLAMRDSSSTTLERDAQRLAALLEGARIQSRAAGVPVIWRATPEGFVFDGLPSASNSGPASTTAQPQRWLHDGTTASGSGTLQLGPEPMIDPQSVTLINTSAPGQALRVATDGLHPFTVQSADAAPVARP